MKRPSNATQKLRREKTRNINIKLAAETVRENKLRRKQKLAWIDQVVEEFHKEEDSKKKMPATKWTPELVHDLLLLREEGVPVPQIAERLGVDVKAVRNKIMHLKKGNDKKEEPKVETNVNPAPDPLLDELIFDAFDQATAMCINDRLPVKRRWRQMLGRIEEQLAGCASIVREHPDAEEHLTALVAVIATDELRAKEMAPAGGNPDEA